MEEWKQRKQEIDAELSKVWVDGGDELAPPPYAEQKEPGKQGKQEDDFAVESGEER